MSNVIAIAHWPGQDTPVCEEHLKKIINLGYAMGFKISWTPYLGNDLTCKNCEANAISLRKIKKVNV